MIISFLYKIRFLWILIDNNHALMLSQLKCTIVNYYQYTNHDDHILLTTGAREYFSPSYYIGAASYLYYTFKDYIPHNTNFASINNALFYLLLTMVEGKQLLTLRI